MVERSLFAIIGLLQGAKSFCTLYGVWGEDFHKKFWFLEENNFILFHYIDIFKQFYCFKNLKRQSESSRLPPDTSSLVYDLVYTTNHLGYYLIIEHNEYMAQQK